MKSTNLLLALAVLASGACDFDIKNPNSPDPIGQDPSRPEVAAAATGLLIGSRGYYADWTLDIGILGREAYRFDGSDPRFISELLIGPFDPGSGAFGGDHWFEPYRNIRSANNLLNVIGTATALTPAETSATRGFAQTIKALDYLTIVNAHTQDSIPWEVNRPITDAPAPLVANSAAYANISQLLDSAQTALQAGGAAFPFELHSGFAGFSTPTTFLRFNRALKARVEVYRGSLGCGAPCYTTAKTILETAGATFIDTMSAANLSVGVYHVFGTGPGDIPNFLSQDPQTSDNLVHPSVRDSAETQASSTALDRRFLAKVVTRPVRSAGTPALSSNMSFTLYPNPSSPMAIIKNEELILLRAEANNTLGNALLAANDINYIRVNSGGLSAIGGLAALTVVQRTDEILRQRKYSLLYEGGHRWIDMRRLGRINDIIIDRPGTDRDPAFASYPIPRDECLARATNPAQCP